ncbi:MAG: type III glutamate--ammonia ligase [Burkholderiales bacterium]|nr:MAG: type III glutamate--ammonia ligase [Burkholderiales bacterium]
MKSAELQAHQSELAASGIHSIFTQLTDLHGVAKGKLVPIERLGQWVSQGAGFAGPSIEGTGLPRMGPRSEYYGRVQPQSLKPLPFMPGVAHAVCDGFAGNEPLDTCSRQTLKRQVARLAERGWTLNVGVEPEFFVFARDEAGQLVKADPSDKLDKPSYDFKSIYQQRDFLDDLRRQLLELGFDVLQIDHEDAWGQYELNYRFHDALEAADRYMLFKMTAHAVAAKHGLVFSAMPKPYAGSPGSGLHFHISLSDAQGNAVMAPAAKGMYLSDTGLQFAAGLLHHADALAALCAPTVNSYKRLAVSRSASGTTWSPVWKAWGENNRSCLLRSVEGRLEWRMPDPACNIYAALSGVIAAGLDGIDQRMQASAPCEEDLYERFAQDLPMPAQLPTSLEAATLALERDASLRAAVGEAFCEQILILQREQWRQWHSHITGWEWQQFGDFY